MHGYLHRPATHIAVLNHRPAVVRVDVKLNPLETRRALRSKLTEVGPLIHGRTISGWP